MLAENLSLIFFSFTASVFFGVVFCIRPQSLLFAGLGGIITRVVLILAMTLADSRLLYTTLAALAAAFYSELIAHRQNTPLAKYLYPALVPIIPGDLLYYTVRCFVQTDPLFFSYGAQLLTALLGLALGSMLAPMLAHSPRYFRQVIRQKIKKESFQ